MRQIHSGYLSVIRHQIYTELNFQVTCKGLQLTEQEKTIAKLLKDMEETAEKIRVLINGMPPEDLLGYIYAQRLMTSNNITSPELESEIPRDEINEAPIPY